MQRGLASCCLASSLMLGGRSAQEPDALQVAASSPVASPSTVANMSDPGSDTSVPEPFRQPVQPIDFGGQVKFPLHIEDGLFTLYTSAYDSDRDAPDPDMDFSRPITAQGPWGAFVNTGAQDHIANVVLAVADGPQEAPAWAEAQDTGTATFADEELTVASLYFHSYGRWTLPQAGDWHYRVSRRGGDRRSTWESTASGPREEWLLQFWPAS